MGNRFVLRIGDLARRKPIELHAVVVLALAIGFGMGADYGLSWDESFTVPFARQVVSAYHTLQAPVEWYSNMEYYGPFYLAGAEVLSSILHSLVPGWSQIDSRHLVYFLSLPLAIVALYSIARRLAGRTASLAAILLFATQPLILGHSFINPKDTPFMAFFLASVASGLGFADRIAGPLAHRREHMELLLRVIVAGAVLGLTTSVRVIGPFAGVLVTANALRSRRLRSVFLLAVYWIVAAVTCYCTWPYLWGNPVGRLLDNLSVLTRFPEHIAVLYRGLVYPYGTLPWHFLPFVILVQLTLPAVLLSVGGGVIGMARMLADRSMVAPFLVVTAWVIVPFAAVLVGRTVVYDNCRQLLFILPPLFVLAALSLDALFGRIRHWALKLAIIVLAILPGVAGIVRLHPYEYVYYNSIVGGVRGAFRHYELDYWATAYREAMKRVNLIAPAGAVVAVGEPWQSAAPFARPDLVVCGAGQEPLRCEEDAAFFIVSTRSNRDQNAYPEARIISEVQVEGVPLAVVKDLRP